MNSKVQSILEFNIIRDKLIDYAVSSMGKQMVRELQPTSRLNEVLDRLSETADAETCIIKRGNPNLGGIHDISAAIKRMEIGSVLNTNDLLKIAGVLGCARRLKKYFTLGKEDVDKNSYVGNIISLLETNRAIEDAINMAIIGEDEISDNASSELKSIRRRILDTQNSIKEKLNSFIHSTKYQKALQDAIVTVRQDRYVIPVKAEHRSTVPGLVHDSSASGQTLFVEPLPVVEANNKIKELRIKEKVEIERILAELTGLCSEFSKQLSLNVIYLGQLDFAFAKAKLSVEYNCIVPQVNVDGIIDIKKGRHPLIDKNKIVPIDFYMKDGIKTVIVTGPNTGGKTVTLKTVGLMTLMTQCGLNIPCAVGTKIAIFDEIYADIGDEQSIEQSLSTFSSHMVNLVDILKNVDNSSLVLLDELGAGTDPTEGAALAMAILETMFISGATTLATTHYSELKQYALTTKGVENASCEFDVNTLRPTYRLLIGVPGKSNAFEISRRLGLDDRIIERSKEFLTAEDVKFEDIMIKLEQNKRQAEEERELAIKQRQEIEKMSNELLNKKSNVQKERERLLREARLEAQQILEKAKTNANEIIAQLQDIKENATRYVDIKQVEESRLTLKRNLDEVESGLSYNLKGNAEKSDINPSLLKVGDAVELITINQKGTIYSLPKDNGDLVVLIGSAKVNCNVANIKLIKENKSRKKSSSNLKPRTNIAGSAKLRMEKNLNQSREIDIRGMAVDEAELVLDKFLDDCSLGHVEMATIIHGKGTGVLRKGVHAFLKRNGHVRAYRIGTYGEGEAGVTIVQLK